MTDAVGPDVERVRRWRMVGAGAVCAEALLAFAAAVALVVHAATGPDRTASTSSNPLAVDLTLALMALLLAAGLAWCARGLLAGRAWCRGPLVTWQLIQLAVGLQSLRGKAAMPLPTGPRVVGAILLIMLAVAVFLGLSRSGLASAAPEPPEPRAGRQPGAGPAGNKGPAASNRSAAASRKGSKPVRPPR